MIQKQGIWNVELGVVDYGEIKVNFDKKTIVAVTFDEAYTKAKEYTKGTGDTVFVIVKIEFCGSIDG
jgi:hypothetical protein